MSGDPFAPIRALFEEQEAKIEELRRQVEGLRSRLADEQPITLKAFVKRYGDSFSESSMRHLLLDRGKNGMGRAVIEGRPLLIKPSEWFRCYEEHKARRGDTTPSLPLKHPLPRRKGA